MQSKSESTNQLNSKPNPNAIPPGTVYEPWCHGVGYNSISPALAAGNVSNSSSLDCPNDSESNDVQSMSNEVNEEDDGVNKELQATASSSSVGHRRQENQTIQQDASAMRTMRDQCFTQHPQLELVGHSIACASHPYQDPYYGGMMAAYGHQHMGYPQIAGTPHARMPLPLEMAQEPVYVNSKQYMGILRRRQARAKADFEKKLKKDGKPYLHESRHQHALRRPRGTGGRFAKKTGDTSNSKGTSEEKGRGSEPIRPSQQDATGSQAQSTNEARNHANGSGGYQNHGFPASTYHSHLGDRGEDGDCSDKQWGSMSSNQASQRPLAIQ